MITEKDVIRIFAHVGGELKGDRSRDVKQVLQAIVDREVKEAVGKAVVPRRNWVWKRIDTDDKHHDRWQATIGSFRLHISAYKERNKLSRLATPFQVSTSWTSSRVDAWNYNANGFSDLRGAMDAAEQGFDEVIADIRRRYCGVPDDLVKDFSQTFGR